MKFENNKLSLAIGLVLTGSAGLVSGSAMAQSEGAIDEVIVTGILQSVKTSMENKRSSDVISDGIASEDLGKFPDQNVAESLQRITGISIDRDGGEGRSVTVRGFGPEFNAVLLNGRVMATDGGNRDFSFDILPADLISGANAYKTNTADILAGGIGATINLTTAKPMDKEGFRSSFTAKATDDRLRGEISPSFSGVASWSNDTLGALVSLSHSKRKYEDDNISTEGWNKLSAYDANGGAINFNRAATYVDPNNPSSQLLSVTGEGDLKKDVYFPRTLAMNHDTGERTRNTGTAVFQVKPTENLTLTADALYSKFVVDSDVLYTGAWTNDWSLDQSGLPEQTGWKTANIDKNQTLTAFSYSPKWNTGWDPKYRVMSVDTVAKKTDRPTLTKEFGLNAEWVQDELKVTYDVSKSSSEDTAAGRDRFVIAKDWYANAAVDLGEGQGKEFPSYSYSPSINQLNGAIESDPSALYSIPGMGSHGVKIEGGNHFDHLWQQKLDVEYSADAGILTKIKAGFYQSGRTKEFYNVSSSNNTWDLYWDHKIDLPDEFFTYVSSKGFMGGRYPTMIKVDADKYLAYLNTDEAINQLDPGKQAFIRGLRDGLGGKYGYLTPVRQDGNSNAQTESAKEFYTRFDFKGDDLFGLEWSGNVGARYVQTDISAYGYQQNVETFEDRGDNEVYYLRLSDAVAPVWGYNSYNNLLPSANLSLNLNDEMMLRFAFSETMTRPSLSALNPSTNGFNPRKPNPTASAGNPKLKPYESQNFDVSYEWYYADASYISLAYFHKNTDNFVIFENKLESFLPNQVEWLVNRPRNNRAVSLDGIEAAVQHTFANGFGVQANYTYVKPSKEFDPFNPENSFGLIGLSDSANLVGFYEHNGLQIRVAYNWRDAYLQSMSGAAAQPETQEAYGQIDASASYELNDNVTLMLEGVNLTDSMRRSYQVYENRLLTLQDTGTRYTLGVRVKF